MSCIVAADHLKCRPFKRIQLRSPFTLKNSLFSSTKILNVCGKREKRHFILVSASALKSNHSLGKISGNAYKRRRGILALGV